jgi:hypothetical protein
VGKGSVGVSVGVLVARWVAVGSVVGVSVRVCVGASVAVGIGVPVGCGPCAFDGLANAVVGDKALSKIPAINTMRIAVSFLGKFANIVPPPLRLQSETCP